MRVRQGGRGGPGSAPPPRLGPLQAAGVGEQRCQRALGKDGHAGLEGVVIGGVIGCVTSCVIGDVVGGGISAPDPAR